MPSTLPSNASWSLGTTGGTSSVQISPSSIRSKAHDRRARRSAEVARRVLNVMVATIGIVLTAPLMLFVAVLVRLDSKGPAIYKQERVGLCRRRARGGARGGRRRERNLGGRVFTIYKFRTMTVAQNGGERWATKNDARITRLGPPTSK